ncbi:MULTISPECIES: DUF4145 domain-containing protein [unclassified Chryseobacterium]|uniref:DUF4145 domain-containing protein n=1 Tax=unclassified Chryseobacterium TaxID=2593645 RepID=UPI000D3C1279|nr:MULTISPECIES: DUF4145 domain-containing protein [unclassified Chryseobacterium]PTT76084.1 hypothetical protein DBR25_06915 [Chryseobacterium sp. HMWF001]PVV60589.1 DUF4145 domain-containing protein [Chryseobacterium sp. HMWF035]
MAANLSEIISCGYCSNMSHMTILGSVSDLKVENEPENGHYIEYGIIYEILKCPACKKNNIVYYNWNSYREGDSDFEPMYISIFPVKNDIPKGLPENIEKAFIASDRIKNMDPNSYAVLSRRLLEMVCLDRNASGRTLHDKLNDLSVKGEIPDKLAGVSMGLKNFGNIGAHAELGEVSEKEISIINALILAVLEYIYSAPQLATEAENKLNEIKNSSK